MQKFAVFIVALLQSIVLVQGFSGSSNFFSSSSGGNLASSLLQNVGFSSSGSGDDSSSMTMTTSFPGSSGSSSTPTPSSNIFSGLTSSFGSHRGSDRFMSEPRSALDLIKDMDWNLDVDTTSSDTDNGNAVQMVRSGGNRQDGDSMFVQRSSGGMRTPSEGISIKKLGAPSTSTSYTPSTPSNPPPTGNTYSGNSWVDAHNARRRRHCVPDVQWSDSVASSAQSHANQLAYSCAFYHSSSGYGENLFMGSGSSYPADYVLSKWYDDEKPYYNYNSPGFSSGTGHFTQVVWSDTRYVGCATSSCGGGEIVVCQYSTAGNVQGYFQQNVPREC